MSDMTKLPTQEQKLWEAILAVHDKRNKKQKVKPPAIGGLT